MKLKLSQIIEASRPLSRLGTEKLPARLAFRLKRNIGLLNPELEAFQKETDRLVKEKYGVVQADGKMIVPVSERPEFQKEVDGLVTEEVELDIRTIALDELTCEISALDLGAIEWMFTEEKPKH